MAPKKNNEIEEYKDASANARQYANMHFAQFTLFFAVTAGLFNLTFGTNVSLNDPVRLIVKVVGLVMALAMLIIEERMLVYWNNFRDRAKELESSLEFSQYKNSVKNRHWLVNSSNATRLIYVIIAVIWVATLISGQ